jgi:hypothetical protein
MNGLWMICVMALIVVGLYCWFELLDEMEK